MPPFRWEDIDHRLVTLRLNDYATDLDVQIDADERRITFENRFNMNAAALPFLILEMKQKHVDEWLRKIYETYCDVWHKQGRSKCPDFVRAVFFRAMVPFLRHRSRTIVAGFIKLAGRRHLHIEIRDARIQHFERDMVRLESRWQKRIEADAIECEHTERIERQSQDITRANAATTEISVGRIDEPTQQFGAVGTGRADVLQSSSPTKKPGRRPRLPQTFVLLAAELRSKAILESGGSVSLDQLCQIAAQLDGARHLPPAAYLEGRYAQEVKDFNSRHSNSKIGPIKTWAQLVSHGDKDHLRGMRRLLSRCAKKLKPGFLSGN